jgi:hypothetical protein
MRPVAFTLTGRLALAIAIVIYLLPIISIEYQVLVYTKWVWAYPLDDAYIHMAIAKNMALHQIWGSSRYAFTSASSSILYPFILAALYKLFGLHLIIPFLVNVAAGMAVLLISQQWLRRQGIDPIYQLIILVAIIFFTPLPVIVIIGMEHTIQVFVCTMFIYYCCDWLGTQEDSSSSGRITTKKALWPLYLYGILVTTVRFEGVFTVAVACLFLVWKKHWLEALLLGGLSALPIFIFGLYSLHQGSYFLPNSVLLKSGAVPQHLSDIPAFITDGIWNKLFYERATHGQVAIERLLLILPIAYFFFLSEVRRQATYRYLLIFLMAVTLLHLILASTVWFFRYEAYLICASISIIGALAVLTREHLFSSGTTTTKWVAAFLLVFLSVPVLIRAWIAISETVGACHDIYNQNYQMAEFLHRYYDTTVIAINDLGAVSYFTSGNNLDMWGLANVAVAKSKREGRYTDLFLDSLVRKENVKIAVVFDRLYSPWLLQHWKKVATWHIDQLTVAGDPNLNFYAVDTMIAVDLKRNLRSYQPGLPPEVGVKYY